MPSTPPLKGRDFYDGLPPINHRTGDIWRELPTFGMLGRSSASGIVITPACDLENEKCETLTYLPIISVADYLLSSAFRYDCWQEISPLLGKLPGFGGIFPPKRYELMSEIELRELIDTKKDDKGKQLSEVELNRLAAYQAYVEGSNRSNAALANLKGFF